MGVAQVDEHVVAIGSTTKAFTSATLTCWSTRQAHVGRNSDVARLQAAGRICKQRDDRARPAGVPAARLGAGDLLFYPPPSDRSRAEIVHSLRYIKPASSFRSTFAYSNMMYPVAGEVIKAVGGQLGGGPWQRIFAPADDVTHHLAAASRGESRLAPFADHDRHSAATAPWSLAAPSHRYRRADGVHSEQHR
jgi:hypothetical protein